MKHISVCLVKGHEPARSIQAKALKEAPALRLLRVFSDAGSILAEIAGLKTDVIVIDFPLSGRNELGAIRELKRQLPETQIVVLAGSARTDDLMGALRSGASGYLLKPCSPGELIEAIVQAWAGGVPMSPGIARKIVDALYEPPPQNDPRLSPREQEVLHLLGRGCTPKEIVVQLGIRLNTVRFHIRRIYAKLKVRSRGEAIVKLLR